MKSLDSYRAVACIFQTLAPEARVRIVQGLSGEQEKSVSDSAHCCQLGWSTVSHHFAILRQAGIAADEKVSQQVFYRIIPTNITDLILCLEEPTWEPSRLNTVRCR